MQHVIVDVQQEKPSSYSILTFVISLFGCPLRWMPEAGAPFAPPPCTPLLGCYALLYSNLPKQCDLHQAYFCTGMDRKQ